MKIRKQVDRELILSKVSQEQIFRYYYPYKFRLNERCLSCFKEEKNPSMIIGTKSQSGEIIFKCFNSSHGGDCIAFVMQLYNLDYHEALEKIAGDFGITNEVKYREVIEKLPPVEVIKPKKAPKIIVATRPFTKQELKYWEEYDQGLEDLKRENIYAPKQIWVNGDKKPVDKSELVFCYYYPEIDKWKIYKPFAKKEFKWYTNVPFDYIENIKNVENCKKVLIAKSKKDKMVLQKALNYDCMITSQAEDLSCFNEESIRILKTCKNVYTVFDNDTKGKSASWTLTNNFEFKHCNVPDKYLAEGITDFADLYRVYGSYRVREQFVKKKII